MKAAVSLNRPNSRHTAWVRGLMLTALVAGAWVVSTSQAQARDDVYWSIGVNSPGVAVGVSNAPPVVVQHGYPVYSGYPIHAPHPVYHQRPIVIQHPPVVVHQPYPYGYVRPVVVAPAPYFHPGRGHGSRWDDRGNKWRHKGEHKRHGRHNDRYDRHDRDDGWHDHRN